MSVGVSLFPGMSADDMGSGGEFLNDLYALDIDRLEWRRIIPKGTHLPEPRAAHTACVVERRILVFGGQTQDEPLNELLEFNLDLVTWRRVQLRGSNPSPRSGHSSCVVSQVRQPKPDLSSPPVDCSIPTAAQKFEPLMSHQLPHVPLQGKKMVIFGGFDGNQPLHDLYILDTTTYRWMQIDLPGGHPLGRSGAACAMMGSSRMYMMGGYSKVPAPCNARMGR